MEVVGLCISLRFLSDKMAKGCTGRLGLRSNRFERAQTLARSDFYEGLGLFAKDKYLDILNQMMNVEDAA